MTKLAFEHEKHFTDNNLKMFHNSLGSKTSIVLMHSKMCGHCIVMRPQFEEYKKKARHDVFEFEGSTLSKLQQYPALYKRVTPEDGSMYFPMIFIFVIVKGMAKPKRFVYEGERTSKALGEFVKARKGELSKEVAAKRPKAARPAKPASAKKPRAPRARKTI